MAPFSMSRQMREPEQQNPTRLCQPHMMNASPQNSFFWKLINCIKLSNFLSSGMIARLIIHPC